MSTQNLTGLLVAWGEGDREALDRLAPLVYAELRRLAVHYLHRERPGHTLETGALVHEAFLRLVEQRRVSWQGRAHFYGVAALMMRRVLVEHARVRAFARRGRGAAHLPLEAAGEIGRQEAPEVVALDEAVRQLAERHPEVGRIVELRFFGGLTEGEIAAALGVSVPTVKRRWRLARAWLFRYLSAPA